MKNIIILVVLILPIQVLATGVTGPTSEDQKKSWDYSIGRMTGINFPQQMTCITEKLFECGFDTLSCGRGISDYPKDYTYKRMYFDFTKMRVIVDKGVKNEESVGDLGYIGRSTYSITQDKRREAGLVVIFSSHEEEIYFTWIGMNPLRPSVQAHSGRCVVH